MRLAIVIVCAMLLAGCGSSAPSGTGTSPTATPLRQLHYSHPPRFTIKVNDQYTATVKSTDGTFTIQLLPKVAPITVNNFVFLARHHFYDGNLFFRILQNSVVQTGDPTGTGFGGPGYKFKDEPVTMPYTRGVVAMANSGPNTNGSQFFIVTAPPGLRDPFSPAYTIFGRVISGMNAVERISRTPVAPNPGTGEVSSPLVRVAIDTITIHQRP